jgi:Fic/DOC family
VCYWQFLAEYLKELKGTNWCLSPEQSLHLHAGNWTVPKQLAVRSITARNNKIDLLYETALLDMRVSALKLPETVVKEKIRIYALPAALCACGPRFFTQHPVDARTALLLIHDSSEILQPLLAGGHTTVAGRLAGAFRNIGQTRIADDIIKTMHAADYLAREVDPFEIKEPALEYTRKQFPIVNRIKIMWQQMREPIIRHFPSPPGLPTDKKAYLKCIEAGYINDAYHSLSIEGYRVSRELIERVRRGQWDPNTMHSDQERINAMAARGYWQAYQDVRESFEKIIKGKSAGVVVAHDHADWYRELFAPSVSAGLLEPRDLAGYRNGPVYIRQSRHIPLRHDAIRDALETFFELLQNEVEPSVRVVLGHFMFVYIHPYSDGNGRMGRFLMNAMLASAGYPWTVVPFDKRDAYLSSLEEASVTQDMLPFLTFIAGLVEDAMRD